MEDLEPPHTCRTEAPLAGVVGIRLPRQARVAAEAHRGHSERVYAETERAGLCEFLDLQRESLIEKLQGVSNEDARRAPTISSLSLLSLVKHSAIWERRWFQIVVAGRSVAGEWPEVQPHDENGFRITDDDTVGTVITYYRKQIAVSQEILRTFDLDAPCARREIAGNLRWVAIHMIEEPARHAGHADIIRETIDSSRT
jgi:hypothetical protein